MRTDTPRLAPLTDDQLDAEQEAIIAPFRAVGADFGVSRAFVRHPAALKAFRVWATYVMIDRNPLAEREREILAMRTAWRVRCGYVWSRHVPYGRKVGLTSFLVVQMFPATLLIMPLYVILHRLGLLGSIGGLVLVYATTAIPFCVWTLKGYFDSMPRELEEAARIDGASAWQIFRRIVLPLARPGLAVTALFSFMTAWNEFIMASTFMTDERSYTLPVLLNSRVDQFSADWGLFAAGAIVTSVPVMIAFYFLQKYLVGGLTAGAVKG